MNRHTIEIKTLLQNKKLGKSRYNPQVSMKIIPESPLNRGLKRCESSSQLRKQQQSQMLIMQDRYRKLQQNYRVMLDQTKTKAQLFAKQKAELEKYKIQSQKDKKEIERLRSMLGFMKKQDFGIQVEPNIQSRITYDKDTSKLSNYSKTQKSTDIGMNELTSYSKEKDRKISNMRQSRAQTPIKMMMSKTQTNIYYRSPLKQCNMRSPISKYKFVPTLTFH